MNIRVVCRHCNNEIGLFDKEYAKSLKKYVKCTCCGNSVCERKARVATLKKLKNIVWKEGYSQESFFGVHEGFDFIQEEAEK